MMTDTDSALGDLTGTVVAPEVPCPDLPCRDCGRPRLLDTEAGWLACGNIDCPNLAILAPVWGSWTPSSTPAPRTCARPGGRGPGTPGCPFPG